jgi:serine/threonine protein kinase
VKPANILVNEKGQVKIGDLGLARLYQEPLQSLYTPVRELPHERFEDAERQLRSSRRVVVNDLL